MQRIYTAEPVERVEMDIIGPLPKTDRGNRYIIKVVDNFTKHVETYAIEDQNSRQSHKCFLIRLCVLVWNGVRAAHRSRR